MQREAKVKVLAAALTASLGFAAYKAKWEGEKLKPYYDSGRVATIGIGTTKYPPWYMQGKKVSITDPRITVKQSREFAAWHSQQDAEFLRKSLPNVYLTQEEFDVYLDFTYQYGRAAWQGSSMRKHLLNSTIRTNDGAKREDYLRACNALLNWHKVRIRGKLTDCRPRNSGCYGVWVRQLDRQHRCTEANA